MIATIDVSISEKLIHALRISERREMAFSRMSTMRIICSPPELVAPFADQERAYEQLRIALEEIHFLYGEKGPVLMHGLRHLLGRANPSAMEVRLLLGLARQIRWFVEQNRPRE